MNQSLLIKMGLGLGSMTVPSAVAIHKSQEIGRLFEERDIALKKADLERHKTVHKLDEEVNKYSLLYKKEKERADSELWHKNKFKKYTEKLQEEIEQERKSFKGQADKLEEQHKSLKQENYNIHLRLIEAHKKLPW